MSSDSWLGRGLRGSRRPSSLPSPCAHRGAVCKPEVPTKPPRRRQDELPQEKLEDSSLGAG